MCPEATAEELLCGLRHAQVHHRPLVATHRRTVWLALLHSLLSHGLFQVRIVDLLDIELPGIFTAMLSGGLISVNELERVGSGFLQSLNLLQRKEVVDDRVDDVEDSTDELCVRFSLCLRQVLR